MAKAPYPSEQITDPVRVVLVKTAPGIAAEGFQRGADQVFRGTLRPVVEYCCHKFDQFIIREPFLRFALEIIERFLKLCQGRGVGFLVDVWEIAERADQLWQNPAAKFHTPGVQKGFLSAFH